MLRALDAEGERLLPSGSEAEIPGGGVVCVVSAGETPCAAANRGLDLPTARGRFERIPPTCRCAAERLFADAVAVTARGPAPFAWEKLFDAWGEQLAGPETRASVW